jgi:glycosyltransferase involved in cell wall biosynthesis
MHGISYIITTYNRPKELNRAIASVLAERNGASELIIVDDHSTIPVQLPVELQARLGIDIHLRRTPQNLGIIQARNVGLAMANYDFVIYLDDDDVSFANRSRDLLAAMQDEYAFVAGKCEMWTGQATITIPNLAGCRLTPINLLPAILHINSVLWRKATLLAFGGFDNRISHLGEHITMQQMLLRGEKALLVEPIVARYKWFDDGLTAKALSANQMKDLFIAYHDILLQESQLSPYHNHYVQISTLLPGQTIITVDDYLSVVARYFANQQ